MTIALVAASAVNNRATGVSSIAVTVTGAAAGDLIPIIIAGSSATPTFVSLIDSTGDTVSAAVTYGTTSGFPGLGIYYVLVATAGSHTLTFTVSATEGLGIFAARYTGVAATPLDSASALHTQGGTSITTASITPAANGALVIMGVSGPATTTGYTFGNGFGQEAFSATSPVSGWADIIQTTAAAISGAATATAAANSQAAIAAFKAALGAPPTVTTVNGGSAITEGATGVAVVGTNFAAGMTSNVLQPGVSIAQATTFTSATAASFNLSMEPAGTQLAFTDATYTTTYTVTVSGQTSTAVSATLQPPAGLIFQTLASINPTSSQRITATPDLVVGDQLEAAGDALGTTAVPTGLSLNSDATYQFAAGDTPANFWVRAYDGTAKVWGAWAEQTVVGPAVTPGKMLLLGVG